MISVNTSQATACLVDCMAAGLMPMIKGSPAIGKSSIVRDIAKQHNLKLIDIRLSQCDPCDLLGFPDIDRVNQKASYVPMDMFPLEGDKIPDGYNGWLLFFDEANSADRAVQKAWYKVVLDRQVGTRNIHKNVAMISAGNLETDNAIVEDMSTALESRMVHFKLEVDDKEWLKWAMANKIDHRITSFIQFKPTMLNTFKPDHSDVTYASPRTWEFASRLLKQRDIKDDLSRITLSGTISEGVTREFMGFCTIYDRLPRISEILVNPKTTPVPEEASVLYAMTGSLASHTTKANLPSLINYIKRLPAEFQVVCLQEVIRRDDSMLHEPTINDWIVTTTPDLW